MVQVTSYTELQGALTAAAEQHELRGLADVHLRAATAILRSRIDDGVLPISPSRLAAAIDRIGHTLIPAASSIQRWAAYAKAVRYETEAEVNQYWQDANHRARAAGKVNWRYNPQLTLSLANTIMAQLSH